MNSAKPWANRLRNKKKDGEHMHFTQRRRGRREWRMSVAISLSLILLLGATISSGADEVSSDTVKIVTSNNTFALDLYAKLKSADGNIFFSPYSISTALAMTFSGARSETESQMRTALRFPSEYSAEQIASAFGALQKNLMAGSGKNGYELSIANGLWGQKDYKFLETFISLNQQYYGAGLNLADFKNNTEGTRNAINAWVEKETRDKIKELIKPGCLNPLSRLVLANAIYFKGEWSEPFKAHRTRPSAFILNSGETVKVPTMHQTTDLSYAEDDNVQVLELPYGQNDISMIIVLTKEKGGLTKLESSITIEAINTWLQNMTSQKVAVSLPKFTATSEFGLAQILQDLGMRDAFSSGKADFSGMDGSKLLFISAVLHKAFVDVNEEGTEAAAATAVMMECAAMPSEPPVEFSTDHAFMFLIRDKRNGSILFMGRITDPDA